MHIPSFPPSLADWKNIPSEKLPGETGFVISKKQTIGEITIRYLEYSPHYSADHWCEKGHLVFVTEGSLILEHKDNTTLLIEKGMSYLVGDNSSAHKAKSITGASVIIVD